MSRITTALTLTIALFAGAATDGERLAAGAAAERIREKLSETAQQDPEIEIKFSIQDPWSRQLFVALCRRYGLQCLLKQA